MLVGDVLRIPFGLYATLRKDRPCTMNHGSSKIC